jgi:hypothetical protein
MTVGDVARIDLGAARAAARKFMAEATLGQDPLKARQVARDRATVTFGKVAEAYLTAKAGVRPNTRRHQIRYLREYFKDFHKVPIDSIYPARRCGGD